jgi:hypothetical protein
LAQAPEEVSILNGELPTCQSANRLSSGPEKIPWFCACGWRIRIRAAIGVWYNPRQYFCRRYESNLTRLHSGVSIGGVPARAAWVRLDDPAITLSALKKKAAIPVRLPSL